MSSFGLFFDEAMSQSAAVLSQVARTDLTDAVKDFTLYFGSPLDTVKLQTTDGAGVNDVKLVPADITPKRENSKAYVAGDVVEPASQNGYCYKAKNGGTSGATEPTWNIGIGSEVADGAVVWKCVSKTHEPSEIKLALSSAALKSAIAGAPLTLGKTINGGVAVPVYVRLTNAVDTVWNTAGKPQICIGLNDCSEFAK